VTNKGPRLAILSRHDSAGQARQGFAWGVLAEIGEMNVSSERTPTVRKNRLAAPSWQF